MRVGEVMTSPVRTIGPDDAASAAWEVMRRNEMRHLVVTTTDGQVQGILSASDLGGKHGRSLRETRRVADLLTEPL
jgi:CBS domain-containing protein